MPEIDPAEEEAYIRALCTLASLPRPPQPIAHGWDTALLRTKKSKKLIGWVQLAGQAKTKDDAEWFAVQADGERANLSAGIWPCGVYRTDPNRITLVTAIVRHSGDARKGDYVALVALGAGHDNPRGTRLEVKDVDELGARIAAMKVARELVGEPLEDRHITNDDWQVALDKVAAH